jgi:hypothetical protein
MVLVRSKQERKTQYVTQISQEAETTKNKNSALTRGEIELISSGQSIGKCRQSHGSYGEADNIKKNWLAECGEQDK